MKDDPAIEAVRKARHEISASVGHDPQKLVDYYRQRQQRSKKPHVSRRTHEHGLQEKNTAAT